MDPDSGHRVRIKTMAWIQTRWGVVGDHRANSGPRPSYVRPVYVSGPLHGSKPCTDPGHCMVPRPLTIVWLGHLDHHMCPDIRWCGRECIANATAPCRRGENPTTGLSPAMRAECRANPSSSFTLATGPRRPSSTLTVWALQDVCSLVNPLGLA
jgi:hypothetical protein